MNFELKDIRLRLCTKVQLTEQKAAGVETKKQLAPTQPSASSFDPALLFVLDSDSIQASVHSRKCGTKWD